MSIHDKFYEIVSNGISDSIKNEFNPITEFEILSKLESSCQTIQSIYPRNTNSELHTNLEEPVKYSKLEMKILIKNILTALSDIETIEAMLKQKVYLNEYSNKYGKKYIQARTSHVKNDGKTAWINAYVGPIGDFKLGTKDPEAIKLGREYIRKKLLEKGIFKI